ncbi:MAG: hypothetical protein J07HQW1_03074 [Haloquadratum walsbyi J07HQW1]|uniref:Uncharacterized protein n=1 Tax=Haloquadratum walsbyi J07HQW1 TaxID=1238424 RepID=U1PLB7_9EURY|nr:MAG: hypothetical protein J07HQW1_03074 [Haloquadratum walsbyi J07HQW1]
MAPNDVRVLEDTERRFADGTVLRVRVLSVPESEKFPDGVKYRLHFGTEDETTLIRYDNSHGVHERHTSNGLDDDYRFPGYGAVQERFWTEIEQLRDEKPSQDDNNQ